MERPVPVRSLKDSPLTMRFVVEAVVNEPYVVEEKLNLLTAEKKLVSPRRVDEAAVPEDVST
jgi:hypothetical protein